MSIHRKANEYSNLVSLRATVHTSVRRSPALSALLLVLGCSAVDPNVAAETEALGQSEAALSSTAALLDFFSIDTLPFPSDLQTTQDPSHRTGKRVNLPKPNCSQRPSDCQDIDVLNALDGFSLSSRISIPFSGPVNLATVNSSTVFLVQRGTTPGGNPLNTVIGINRVVWDPSTNTLYAQPDKLLEQSTPYLLVAKTGIKDLQGNTIAAGNFNAFPPDPRCAVTSVPAGQTHPCTYKANVLAEINAAGLNPAQVATANMFTTQSVTAVLEKIRDQIKASTPDAAVFNLAGGANSFYALNTITEIVFKPQTGVGSTHTTSPLFPVEFLNLLAPNAVGTIAFGRYTSPNYQTAQLVIPPVGTAFGTVPKQGPDNSIFFNLFLPSGPKPPGGWRVAVHGPGLGESKQLSPTIIAARLAAQGIATVAINVVGNGGGPAGTLVVKRNNGQADVTLPAGGRGIDQDGNGTIEDLEGSAAVAPQALVARRDGHRQTVADLMQLVRIIETRGLDIDGDGVSEVSQSDICYSGISYGGIYGSLLMAVEPSVRAGVLIVGGGSIAEVLRLGIVRKRLLTPMVGNRVPSLLNVPSPDTGPLFGFNENLPLRNEPPRINNVPGAIEIQTFLDRLQWAEQAGDAVPYARHIRKQPLSGLTPKPVIIQIAKGDQNVPNPTSTALIEAGGLTPQTTYFRNDLAFAANANVPKNPHTSLFNVGDPAVAGFAILAQQQIATFFASNGTVIIDPDGPNPFFETPIVGPLPETLNFIP